MTNNQPAHQIRLGVVKAAIWENQGSHGIRHTVTVCRLYKDGDQWGTTESFGRDDLLLAGKVLNLAHNWICEQGTHEESKT